MGHTCTALNKAPCPLQQSCMAMHEEHMEAQPPMGLKGDSGDGGMRLYQVPSKVQGEAGNACDGRHGGCMGVDGGAWRCMGVHGALAPSHSHLPFLQFHLAALLHEGRQTSEA